MALSNTGIISFSDVNVELGFSSNAQINFSDSAVRVLANILTGAISFNDFYGKAAGITVTLSNASNVNLESLFDPGDWANSNLDKTVIVPPGVTISSSDNTLAAMRSSTGWAGYLGVKNYGSILAAGGSLAHPVGGDAFAAEAAGIDFQNYGDLWAGGGSGGSGGAGGAGTNSVLNDSGWRVGGNPPSYWIPYSDNYGANISYIYWNSNSPLAGGTYASTSLTFGIYTYYKGSHWSGSAYYIKRTWYSNVSTTGGVGGSGGRGQGYGQSALSGSAGAAGGTNAGTGGTGGTGGGWGSSGSNGATGANGNAGSGVSGITGALAGYAIKNIGNVTLTNTGSILGR